MSQYNGVDMHRRMVSDVPRTERFRESIQATVTPGDVVLDVGAGSGILSLFAAAAGASRVYAVEREPATAELARQLVADNDFSDVVEVMGVEIERASLAGQVDVIVSEWLGVYGVDENMLAPVLLARDRWLRPGGAMIPGAVTAWIAPVSHPIAAAAIEFHGRTYDLDLTALAAHDPNAAVWLPEGVAQSDTCADPQPLWTVDPATTPLDEAIRPYAAELTFPLARSGVNGLAAWFSAEMPGTTPLSNAPGEPLTHWGHFLFPLVTAAGVAVGDALTIGFHNVPAPEGGSNHLWSRHQDGELVEAHDTRRFRRAPGDPPWLVAAGP